MKEEEFLEEIKTFLYDKKLTIPDKFVNYIYELFDIQFGDIEEFKFFLVSQLSKYKIEDK